jgi:hypothetical protein
MQLFRVFITAFISDLLDVYCHTSVLVEFGLQNVYKRYKIRKKN